MKNYSSLLAVLICTLLFSACNKKEEEQQCGEENNVSLNITSATDFDSYHYLVFNDNIYQTEYIENYAGLGYSFYNFQLMVPEICNHSSPNVDFMLQLHTDDPNIHITAYWEESNLGGNTRDSIDFPSATTYNNHNFDYTLKTTAGSATMLLEFVVAIPYQGNAITDSTYFFTNMWSVHVGVLSKKPA